MHPNTTTTSHSRLVAHEPSNAQVVVFSVLSQLEILRHARSHTLVSVHLVLSSGGELL